MKKIDLGQLVTILANIGVIAGIVFLALELRQTQRSMAAQAYQARAFDAIAWQFELAQDADQRRIWLSSRTDDDFDVNSLTGADYEIVKVLYTAKRTDVDNEHYQYQNGFLDPGFYNSNTVPDIASSAPIWRALGLDDGRPEFHLEVERILKESGNAQ